MDPETWLPSLLSIAPASGWALLGKSSMIQYAVVVCTSLDLDEEDMTQIEDMIENKGYVIMGGEDQVPADYDFQDVQIWVFYGFKKVQYSFRYTYVYKIGGPFRSWSLALFHKVPLWVKLSFVVLFKLFLLKAWCQQTVNRVIARAKHFLKRMTSFDEDD
jgi:hypothetical protein